MREIVAACLLLVTTSAHAYRGRPVTDLRFDSRARVVSGAKAASDGNGFLLFFASWRSGYDPHVYTQKIGDGRAAGPQRLIGRGEPMALAWTGAHYLAGWVHEKKLWVATVSREGSPLSIPVAPVLEGEEVLLAADHDSALAFGYTDDQLTVQPLDVNGAPSGVPVVHTAPTKDAWITAAPAADGFGVVFSGWHGTWLMLFRADGTAITGAPVLLDGPYEPAEFSFHYHSNLARIATDGTDTLVVFGAGITNGDAGLRSVVVGANGTVNGAHELHTVPELGDLAVWPEGVVWDGTQYVAAINVFWDSMRWIGIPTLLRIGRDGQRIGDAVRIPPPQNDFMSSLAFDGRELLMPFSLEGVTVDPATLQSDPPFPVGQTLGEQDLLRLAAGRDGYLAAWLDRSDGKRHIRASRIDGAGNYRDGNGIVLQTRDVATDPVDPADIAIDGNGPQWLVVWSAGSTVYGRFVSRGGAPGAHTIAIGTGTEVAVRWDGSKYVVLFSDPLGTLQMNTVSPAGVAGEPTTLAAWEQFPIQSGMGTIAYRHPRLALLGGQVVAFHTKEIDACGFGPPGGGCEAIHILGRRLDGDTAPFTVAENTWGEISVAGSPSQALVTWTRHDGVRGTFVSSAAQPGNSFPIAPGIMSSVAFDGRDFVVAGLNAARDLFTARVTAAGAVDDMQVLTRDAGEEASFPILAASATQAPLLGFEHLHPGYDRVLRASLLLVSEIGDATEPPPAPAVVCAAKNDDGTITVRWQTMQNVLGFSVELEIGDGTFRQIGVAPGAATSARVSPAGLGGDAVRVRAWNAGGLSEASPIAPGVPPPAATLRSSMRACAEVPATISISLSGVAPFTVHWSDGAVQRDVRTHAATRTVAVSRDTTFTIVAVEDASCAVSDTPESVRVTVDPQPAIQDQTRETKVTPGQAATLSVVASDAARYAWFEGARGDTSRPVGGDAATFTTPVLTQSARYWVRVTNRCGSVDSLVMNVIVQGKRRAARR